MSSFIAENVIDNETLIAEQDLVETILEMLSTLVKDQEDGPKAEQWEDPDEFMEEQGS